MIFRMYKNLGRSFFRFVTMHAFDRRTDGQTDSFLIAIPRLHSMQRGRSTPVDFLPPLILWAQVAPRLNRNRGHWRWWWRQWRHRC